MHFIVFFLETHPPQAVRGRCCFIKIKIAETYAKIKKIYIFWHIKSNNKSTVTRICRMQRYLNHVELAIDFQIQLNILGILWNGLKTRVTSSYQLCSLLKCRYNSYTVCGLYFTSKYFGTNNRLLNVAVPSTQYNFLAFPVQTYFQ
jgi:hypothetical protein